MRKLILVGGYVSLVALGCSDDTIVSNGNDVASFQTALTGIGGAIGGGPGVCPFNGLGGSRTAIGMQAELLPVADISAGDNQYILTGSEYCNSQSRRLAANAVGDFITYGPISYPTNVVGQTWDIQLRTARNSVAGKISLAYAPSSTGPWRDLLAPLDLYSATSGPQVSDLGGIVFQDSPTFIKFTVVGKNAASAGYNVNVDWLEFVLAH